MSDERWSMFQAKQARLEGESARLAGARVFADHAVAVEAAGISGQPVRCVGVGVGGMPFCWSSR